MSPKTASQTKPVAAAVEDSFYISATQSAGGPRRTLKHNDTFVVLDNNGDMGAAPAAPTDCSTATPAFSRGSNSWSMTRRRCCSAPTCATITRRCSSI